MLQIYQKHIFLWLISSSLLLFCLYGLVGSLDLQDQVYQLPNGRFFSGILPPLSDFKWNEYFELYKKIPEYQKINYGMTLSEFKFIFLVGIRSQSFSKNFYINLYCSFNLFFI